MRGPIELKDKIKFKDHTIFRKVLKEYCIQIEYHYGYLKDDNRHI